MSIDELSLLILWLVVSVLTLVLYLRVHVRDWGMMGLVLVMMGLTTLVTRSVLIEYDVLNDGHPSYVLWRTLVIIGAPFAIAGFAAGVWRDPPPVRQVVARLSFLFVFVVVLTALFAL